MLHAHCTVNVFVYKCLKNIEGCAQESLKCIKNETYK